MNIITGLERGIYPETFPTVVAVPLTTTQDIVQTITVAITIQRQMTVYVGATNPSLCNN